MGFKNQLSKTISRIAGVDRWKTARLVYRYWQVREPKTRSSCPPSSDPETLVSKLRQLDFDVKPLRIDVEDYRDYLDKAAYGNYDYYGGGTAPNFPEKSLEHYLSTRFLNLQKNDVFIDVANDYAPVPEIYMNMFGSIVYRQDLQFPDGVHASTIGGNACAMPVRDGFASKLALHCSLEHFERNDDIQFIREAERILFSGGKMVICPLYLHSQHIILTDLEHAAPEEIDRFDPEATVICIPGWGNRHGRYYDPEQLDRRIRGNLRNMTMTIYQITNAADVDPSCYIRFLAVFEKN